MITDSQRLIRIAFTACAFTQLSHCTWKVFSEADQYPIAHVTFTECLHEVCFKHCYTETPYIRIFVGQEAFCWMFSPALCSQIATSMIWDDSEHIYKLLDMASYMLAYGVHPCRRPSPSNPIFAALTSIQHTILLHDRGTEEMRHCLLLFAEFICFVDEGGPYKGTRKIRVKLEEVAKHSAKCARKYCSNGTIGVVCGAVG